MGKLQAELTLLSYACLNYFESLPYMTWFQQLFQVMMQFLLKSNFEIVLSILGLFSIIAGDVALNIAAPLLLLLKATTFLFSVPVSVDDCGAQKQRGIRIERDPFERFVDCLLPSYLVDNSIFGRSFWGIIGGFLLNESYSLKKRRCKFKYKTKFYWQVVSRRRREHQDRFVQGLIVDRGTVARERAGSVANTGRLMALHAASSKKRRQPVPSDSHSFLIAIDNCCS